MAKTKQKKGELETSARGVATKGSTSKKSSTKAAAKDSNSRSKNQLHSSEDDFDDEQSEDIQPPKKKVDNSKEDTDDESEYLDEDEELSDEDYDDSGNKGRGRRHRSRSGSEDTGNVLSKFRRVLRDSLYANQSGKKVKFATSLYHNVQAIHHNNPDGNIQRKDFAQHLKKILKSTTGGTRISDQDIDGFMSELDSDGSGAIDWDEFVSFMSFFIVVEYSIYLICFVLL